MLHLLILLLSLCVLPTAAADYGPPDQGKPRFIAENWPDNRREHEENQVIKKEHALVLLLLLLCGGSYACAWHNRTRASEQNAQTHKKIDQSFEKLQKSCQGLEKDLLQNKQLHTDMVHTVATLHEAHRIKDQDVAQKLNLLTNQLDQTTKSCALVHHTVADLSGLSKKLERDIGLIDTALHVTTQTLGDQQKELDSFRAGSDARDAHYKANLEKSRAECSAEMALLEQRFNSSFKQHKKTTKERLDEATNRFTDDVRRRDERYQELQHRFEVARKDRAAQESLVAKLRTERDSNCVQTASSVLKVVGAAADWYTERRKQKKHEQENALDQALQKRLDALDDPLLPDVPTHEPGSKRLHCESRKK